MTLVGLVSYPAYPCKWPTSCKKRWLNAPLKGHSIDARPLEIALWIQKQVSLLQMRVEYYT